uniref:CDC73_C domain-containing protein n=1 Tax=Angiostrongylus cantonensis TaxID=6313 RepID=A0A0K0CSN9_ANGCA
MEDLEAPAGDTRRSIGHQVTQVMKTAAHLRGRMSEILRYLCEVASGQLSMKEIIHNNEKYYAFGDRAYHKDTETNLLVYGKQNDYYTIDALLFLWEHRAKTHPSYVRDATAANVKVVSRPDRREILDYLSGNRLEIPTNHNPSHAPAPGIAISRLVPETVEEPEAKKLKLEHNARPRVDQLLNKDRVDPSEVRALNDSLTADKIAALKQKRLTHQKTKIAAVDPDIMAGGAPTEPLVTRYSMDVRKVERVYRTRKTVMNASKKTYTFLFDVLKLIKSREEAARLKERGVDSAKSQPAKFVGMYNRYDQERFGKLSQLKPHMLLAERISNYGHVLVRWYKLEFNQFSARESSIGKIWSSFWCKSIMIAVLIPYLVVDQPNKFTDAEWDRVVAVFITGQLWQFKPFKRWHSNPVEIFAKIPAFHVHYDDLNVDPNVAKWSVTRLPVSRTKRHMDKARFRVFWEVMDRWIPANRPYLRW